MGYAGLNISELTRLLARQHIEAEAIEDDSWGDHCVVKLTDMRYPHDVALLYYENMGIEPRLARCVIGEAVAGTSDSLGNRIRALNENDLLSSLDLIGRRADDPERLATWLSSVFQSLRTRENSGGNALT
jgi:hypothetical protein